MKTLPEILRDAMLLLNHGHERVVIARGHSHTHEPLDGRSEAFQIRLHRDEAVSEYTCEVRSWLGDQWSSWRDRRGLLSIGSFDISDVLATDWRIGG